MADPVKLQVFLRGGLGNQLFQYSTGLYLSEKFDKELVLRTDLLPLSKDVVGGISRWPEQISGFRHSGILSKKVDQPENSTNLFSKYMQGMRMLGDWVPSLSSRINWLSSETTARLPDRLDRIAIINSYAPFKEMALENRIKLREQLTSLVAPSENFLSMRSDLEQHRPIIVHIRRGDYVGLERLYGDLDPKYYLEGLGYMKAQINTEKTWIFSDSPEEVPRELAVSLEAERVIGPADIPCPLENLVLMSLGTAIIAANSTFSWWSGLISSEGQPLVAPRSASAWTHNFSDVDDSIPGWKVLNVA